MPAIDRQGCGFRIFDLRLGIRPCALSCRASRTPTPSPPIQNPKSQIANSIHLFLLLVLLTVGVTAADKSGVGPNTVSLPAGPGSIEGLGESFEPSLNTGTARYGVNLVVPNGTAGNTPALRLSYEGGSGNGPLGFGWDLSLPHVQRQTDKGIPRYVDEPNGIDDDHDGEIDEPDELDRFINELKEELVPVTGGLFFSENEGAFIRYRRVDHHWEATLPDGTRLEFGRTDAGRISDNTTGRVFKWLLERRVDTRGNTIEYVYRAFPGAENLNQKYLAGIRYGPGEPPWNHYHFVTFEYENRADWFEDGRPGFLLRTGKRLRSIVIGTQGVELPGHLAGDFNGDGITDYLNRRYDLHYLQYNPGLSHWSLMSQLTLVGADGVSTQPPARFDYTIADPPAVLDASQHWMGGLNEPHVAMDNPLLDLIDLNGDALPDLLHTDAQGGAHRVYLNLGETNRPDGKAIRWSLPHEVGTVDGLAWNIDLASDSVIAHLADMNGDGLADLAYRSMAGDVHYFANTGQLAWGPRQPMSVIDFAPPAPHGQPNVRTADIDFDKRIDIIESIADGGAYRVWFNRGDQRYSQSVTVPQTAGFDFTLSGVHIADFNGDGVPDIARIRPTSIVVTAGLGHGQFAEPMIVPLPDFILDDTQVDRARLHDVTGNGLVDLVIERAAPGQLWYWINHGNYTLSPRRIVVGMPAAQGLNPTTRWADLNGNGTTDLIYADSASVPRMVIVDLGELMGCVPRPNLLTRIENGIGRITRIEYAPSTRFALDDLAAGAPRPDPLPFPVSVVSRVTVEDSLGHEYVTEYRYHDGYYDGSEKEFRGFARVEQLFHGDSTAPTLVTRSHFHTGRDHTALKGKLTRQTAELEDGRVFWDEVTDWTVPPRVLHIGLNGQTVQYAPQTGTLKSILELGHPTPRQLETAAEYDDYGNRIREIHYGVVEDGDREAMNDERVVQTGFALNLDAWILRAPWRRETSDEHGIVISRTETFYDDESFSGNNPGVVTTGNPTLTRAWIDPAHPGAFIESSRTRYDPYGNPVLTLDPLGVAPGGIVDLDRGHARALNYDPHFQAYPVRETIHIGNGSEPLTIEVEYDPGFGVATIARDFNQVPTRYGYDAFGRLTRMIRAGDSESHPTTEYAYALAHPIGAGRTINYIETRLLDQPPGSRPTRTDHYFIARQFIDGLGRKVLHKTEAEPATPGGPPRAVVQGAVRFNARQEIASTVNPFFSLLPSESINELLAFEDIEAPGWQGLFHEDGALVPLDLDAAHQIRTRYDALMRPVELTFENGSQSRTIYEPLVTWSYDENDLNSNSPHFDTPTAIHRDGLGRHIRTDEWVRLTDDGSPTDELRLWTTRFEFDLNDRLVRITDAQNNVKTMTFDGLQRLVAVHDPNAGTLEFTYDAASNVVESRDAKQQRITFTYDGANRLRTEDYHDEHLPFSHRHSYDPTRPIGPGNRPDVAFFYDIGPGSIDLGDGTSAPSAHSKGRLVSVLDLVGAEHTSYDARGRTEWSVKTVASPAQEPPFSYATRFEYDSLDRLTRVSYPDRDEVGYTYNARNLLDRITGGPAGFLHAVPEYLPSGQTREVIAGNGVVTSRSFDQRLRMRSLRTHPGAAPGEPWVAFDYDFDDASNILAIRDARPHGLVPAGSPRRNSQFFQYDDRYRLTRVAYSLDLPDQSEPAGGVIRYRHDRIGNLIAQTSTTTSTQPGRAPTDLGDLSFGGALGAWNRVPRLPGDPPGPHALTGLQSPNAAPSLHDYDANGNLVAAEDQTCTWDFRNRLVAVANDRFRAEYVYDHLGRRVVKRVFPIGSSDAPASTSLYLNSYFEIREQGQPTKFVWNGPIRVAHAIGALSPAARIQRLSLKPGWNLCAAAVDIPSIELPDTVLGAFRANPDATGYQPLAAGDTVPAGTILWLKAAASTTLILEGTTAVDNTASVPVPGGSMLRATTAVVDLRGKLPIDLPIWQFDASMQQWRLHHGHRPGSDHAAPAFLSPGDVVFVHAETSVDFPTPDSALELRYYHADHLGSSSVLTDAVGGLIEETAYHPFGAPRHEHRPRQVTDPYQFSQKEQDAETGFHYFEARFLSSIHGRFLTPDPLYLTPHALPPDQFEAFLHQPQSLNLYSYTQNNPLKYRDPTGLSLEGLLDDVQRAVGLKPRLIDTEAVHNKNARINGMARNFVRSAYDDAGMERIVFSGHGDYPFNDPRGELRQGTRDLIQDKSQFVEVPEGTSVTFYATHGMTITDRLGNAIEKNTVPAQQYSETYGPGELVPNYRLSAPSGLHVKYRLGGGNVTVQNDVMLEDLLKPNMGPVDWAACMYDRQYGKPKDVPKADLEDSKMLLHKNW